jgi:competence protein ComGC
MKRIKENNGTAIILMLVVVSVLFIFTSFLVRKVIINTTMVEKSGQEQESYAIAKQGILYALDKLNTWQGTAPDYDSTTWLNGENWDAGNWNSYDLNDDGESEVEIRIDKDDIPHPENSDPAFDSTDDDNEDQSYITIESRDSARKLVTLQAIAENNSPMLDYVRFVNSDTVFVDDTFDQSNSTSLIQGEAPFCILGNVTWQSGSKNDIQLVETTSKALIYGTISNDGVDDLEINNGDAKQGYYYFFDPDDSSYDDPDLFDTATGHYFSSAHLPSCYDYSETPSPVYYYGGPQSISWPEIKEIRYQNLASGTNCYINNPSEVNLETEWSDPDRDNDPSYDNDTDEDEWFQDVALVSTSWRYYPYAPRLVLNTTNISQKLPDGTVNTIDYSSITNNIIYTEGDISLSGIIPDGKQLTFVSGGNIFIDSNLLKETNSASLALLAKKNIVLNPTSRYAVNWTTPDTWQDGSGALANPEDGNLTYPGTEIISIPPDTTFTYTLDLDMGRVVTGGRIVLWGYVDGEGGQIDTTLDLLLSRDAASWNTVLSAKDPSGNFHLDFTPQAFRWVRLKLQVKNNHNINDLPFTLSSEGFDAIEVPIYAVDAALFSENGTIQVVSGGGMAQDESVLPNNNAYQPLDTGGLKTPSDSGSYSQRLFFWGTLAEPEWRGNIPGWGYIAYAYDSNLSSSPPPSLPPSVDLVSLKRK